MRVRLINGVDLNFGKNVVTRVHQANRKYDLRGLTRLIENNFESLETRAYFKLYEVEIAGVLLAFVYTGKILYVHLSDDKKVLDAKLKAAENSG